MLKFFWNQRTSAQDAAWRWDPLSHPDLQEMGERELADLPMEPRCFLPEPLGTGKKNPPTGNRMAG